MITLDGYELKEGEFCYVHIQDPSGQKQRNGLYKAHYMDNTAKTNGWDFTIKNLPKIEDADYEWEITGVWKHKSLEAVRREIDG
jgi:hypothetical protein